jgi:two-component system sensor histidine kinase ChiS
MMAVQLLRAPVLVVEDDPDTRLLIQTLLQEEGLDVTPFANGRDAVRWLDEHEPALIVLDMTLPGMSGEDVALNAHSRYGRKVPILVVTGDRRPRERTEEADTFVYLTKPFDDDELLRVVEGLLGPEPPFGEFIQAPAS